MGRGSQKRVESFSAAEKDSTMNTASPKFIFTDTLIINITFALRKNLHCLYSFQRSHIDQLSIHLSTRASFSLSLNLPP